MTELHHAVVTRLSTDFAAISRQLAQVSTDLTELDRILRDRPTAPAAERHVAPSPHPAPATPFVPPPSPQWPPPAPPPGYFPPRPSPVPPPPRQSAPRRPLPEGWIGKALAVAGVAVTLIGVVMLLVLAAQAGVLRPEVRVAMGAILAGSLVVVGRWLISRPGGRVGAIALTATGVAAAYMDVIALTTIYQWLPAPAGLVIAAAVAGGGLMLARRWDSEHLGLLVLVPLLGLAPVITDGITLLLIGFMLALSAASLPVQLGHDWVWLHAARIAAVTAPLLLALAVAHAGGRHDGWLVGACGIATALAIVAALVLLPHTTKHAAVGALTAIGALPALCVGMATGRPVAAMMAAALAAALLAIVAMSDRLPGVPGIVRQMFSALSAVAALIAVVAAFDGPVAGPVLSAMALVLATAGRRDVVARWSALAFAALGGAFYLGNASPQNLFRGTEVSTAIGVSTLVSSVLVIACSVSLVWAWASTRAVDAGDDALADDPVRLAWAGAAAVVIYGITTFMVTAGVLVGGTGGGFLAGHMAATIMWIALAAALFGYAARRAKAQRSLPIGGGMALVAAAMVKLFLFDLGTLDGIFRVAVFIVVGLILLGMGSGYARLLAQQDQSEPHGAAPAES